MLSMPDFMETDIFSHEDIRNYFTVPLSANGLVLRNSMPKSYTNNINISPKLFLLIFDGGSLHPQHTC